MLLHQYTENEKRKRPRTLLDKSFTKIMYATWFFRADSPIATNLTTKRRVILPWGLNPYDLPCLQKSLVHTACGNCLLGSEEPSYHLSSSLVTTSEDIGLQPTRPRRRCSYNRAKERKIELIRFFICTNLAFKGEVSKSFGWCQKECQKSSFSCSSFPHDWRSRGDLFFHKTYNRCPEWCWRLKKARIA